MFQLLFVYGTLMSGFSANVFLSDNQFIGYGVLYGARLLHLDEGYPAVVDGDGRVFGELYQVDTLTLKAIDFFEAFPEKSLYIRTIRPVRLLPYGDFVDAWVYILNPCFIDSKSYIEIPGGNWRDFLKKLLML
ncbi:gamma-glutamylcyclotransferase family protein [Desulfurobacterium sp.]|uniref:gamma-glutamylcyclotransferase family protein n=1 Tax=Desulfurobacterium sp. TaxID=2004706 RepID=UPI0026087D3F|nr:gamma-glutamylcyclotransferase family protein [Desulfurobacterium sp.]